MQDIRDGRKSIMEALYKRNEEGEIVARFNVYVQDPGFLERNYEPVPLKKSTMEIAARFRPPVEASAIAPKKSRPLLHPKAEEILERYMGDSLFLESPLLWLGREVLGQSAVNFPWCRIVPLNQI